MKLAWIAIFVAGCSSAPSEDYEKNQTDVIGFYCARSKACNTSDFQTKYANSYEGCVDVLSNSVPYGGVCTNDEAQRCESDINALSCDAMAKPDSCGECW